MGVEKSFNTAEEMEQNVEALLEAARYADMDDVTSLASSGIPLDSKDSEGRTVSKALNNPIYVDGRLGAKANEQKKRKKSETSFSTPKVTPIQLQDSSSKPVTPPPYPKDKGPTTVQDSPALSLKKTHIGSSSDSLISKLNLVAVPAVPASTVSVKIGKDIAKKMYLPDNEAIFSKYSLSEMHDHALGHCAEVLIGMASIAEYVKAQEAILRSTRQKALDAQQKAKEANDRVNKLEGDLKKFKEEAENELKKVKAEADKLLKAKEKELDEANRRGELAEKDMYKAGRTETLKKVKEFLDEL